MTLFLALIFSLDIFLFRSKSSRWDIQLSRHTLPVTVTDMDGTVVIPLYNIRTGMDLVEFIVILYEVYIIFTALYYLRNNLL